MGKERGKKRRKQNTQKTGHVTEKKERARWHKELAPQGGWPIGNRKRWHRQDDGMYTFGKSRWAADGCCCCA